MFRLMLLVKVIKLLLMLIAILLDLSLLMCLLIDCLAKLTETTHPDSPELKFKDCSKKTQLLPITTALKPFGATNMISR